MNAIPEEIKEEEFVDSLKVPKAQVAQGTQRESKVETSIRKSCEESDIEGLIKWAKDLPDDLASHS